MKHLSRLALAAGAAVLAAAPAAAQAPRPEGPLKHDARPTTGAITPQDLRTHLYVIADDSMKGREAGSRGNLMATEYLAAQARALGLQPAGENGTFFQTVPLVTVGPDEGASLSVDGQPLAMGDDFLVLPRYGSILLFGETFRADGVPVVYGGRVGEPTSMISPEDARGKLVVFAAPLGPNGQPTFAVWAGGRTFERYADAAGIAFATLDLTSPGLREFFSSSRTELQGATDDRALPAGFVVGNRAAEALLGAPMSSLSIGQGSRTASGAFQVARRELPFPARNVVAVLPGRDAALRGQYVSIGAHNDHVGTTADAVDHDSLLVFNRVLRPQGADQAPDSVTTEAEEEIATRLAALRARRAPRVDSIFNGADDDASGSSAVLEIAQFLAQPENTPRRSTLFLWYTAEEIGLYGSEHFTDHPTVPRDSIVANLNIDMIGRGVEGDVENGGPGYLELVGSRRLSNELGDLVEAVNQAGGHGFTFDYSMDTPGHDQQIYCRSDHANFARYGIPVTFFTTGGHSEYHMLTDEPQYIDFDKLARVSRLIASVAQAIGDRDARLALSVPMPDPDAPCRQ